MSVDSLDRVVSAIREEQEEITRDTLTCPFCGAILSQIAVIGERFFCKPCGEEYIVIG